MQDCCWVLCL